MSRDSLFGTLVVNGDRANRSPVALSLTDIQSLAKREPDGDKIMLLLAGIAFAILVIGTIQAPEFMGQ